MVLSSQVTRSASSRRYMASRGRRTRRWPVVALVGVVILVVVFFRWTGNDEPSTFRSAADQAPAGSKALGDPESAQELVEEPPNPAFADSTPQPPARSDAEGPTPEPTRPVQGGGAQMRRPDLAAHLRSVAVPRPEAVVSGETESIAAHDPGAPVPGPPSMSAASSQFPASLSRGMDLVAAGEFVEGRRLLSEVLFSGQKELSPADQQAIRDILTSVNQKLVFSSEVIPGDPAAEYYQVQRGDMLTQLAPRYQVPFEFVAQINGIDPNRLMAGQRIKMIKGPFHLRIVKHDFRLDLLLHGPEGLPLYICSYAVGLGETNSTPVGRWVVAPGKKVEDPAWDDPRPDGRYYPSGDPLNPIGEYWVGLEGMDEKTRALSGYGLHGTIDDRSIGQQASMGCVRLRSGDIEQVFRLVVGGESTVQIVP